MDSHSLSSTASAERGFSLLELMVVLGIIAILAVIAIPSQSVNSMMQHREQVLEGYSHLEKLKDPVRNYLYSMDECPDNTSESIPGFPIHNREAYSGHFVNTVTTGGEAEDDGGCTISARFKQEKSNTHLRGKSVTIRLFGLDNGVPKWACYSDVDLSAYIMLPLVCRFADPSDAEQAQAPEPD